MRQILAPFTLLGALASTACATTQPLPIPLEIPLRPALSAPCEHLDVPAENALPQIAESQDAQAAQLRERSYWMQRDLSHEGVEQRTCRQRDEAVTLIKSHNQLVGAH